jgi:short-subunit dehydrogenase
MNTRPLALITGASSGIGAQIALELARTGHDLVLVARNVTNMDIIADRAMAHGARSTVMSFDLSVPNAAAKLVAEIRRQNLVIDVLVNNAGFGDAAAFYKADAARLDQMVLLNIAALTSLTRAFVPEMVSRGRGRIMMVSSIAAFQPGPGMAVYCATKAYVLSLGEAIADELRGTGVSVTTLCPGATRTGFFAAAHAEDLAIVKQGAMDAASVARVGVKALFDGKTVVVTGFLNKILAWTGRVFPRFLTLPVTRALMAKSGKA